MEIFTNCMEYLQKMKYFCFIQFGFLLRKILEKLPLQQSNIYAYKNFHASCKKLLKVLGDLQKHVRLPSKFDKSKDREKRRTHKSYAK